MKNGQKETPNGNKVQLDNSKVIKIKLRRFILKGTIIYTALVMYFMFLGLTECDRK